MQCCSTYKTCLIYRAGSSSSVSSPVILCLSIVTTMRCSHSYSSSLLSLWLQASRIVAEADPPLQDTITIASHIYVVNPTHVVLNSKTVSPGGSPIEVDGETVSADPRNDLFVNGVEVITVSGDTNLGIPVVPTSCTSSACLVSIQDVSASSVSTHKGSKSQASTNTKPASDSKRTSGSSADKTAHTHTTQVRIAPDFSFNPTSLLFKVNQHSFITVNS